MRRPNRAWLLGTVVAASAILMLVAIVLRRQFSTPESMPPPTSRFRETLSEHASAVARLRERLADAVTEAERHTAEAEVRKLTVRTFSRIVALAANAPAIDPYAASIDDKALSRAAQGTDDTREMLFVAAAEDTELRAWLDENLSVIQNEILERMTEIQDSDVFRAHTQSLCTGWSLEGNEDPISEPRLLAAVPFREDCGRGIVVPVYVDDMELWFLLDTGCRQTVLDSALREKIERVASTAHPGQRENPVVIKIFDTGEGAAGTINLGDRKSIAYDDFSLLRKLADVPIDGALAMDFLGSYVLQIDPDAGEVRFWDRNPHMAGPEPWEVGLELRDGVPYVAARVGSNPIPLLFGVATAMDSSGLLVDAAFDAAAMRGGSPSVGASTAHSKGVRRRSQARFDLVLGGVRYPELILSSGSVSALGWSFLSRHIVTLDFQGGRMLLRRASGFGRSDEIGMSGLCLVRANGQTVVYRSGARRPASAAGVREGDVVLSVQGREARHFSLSEITRLLASGDGKLIRMTIKREEETFEVSFRLKRRL